MSERHPPSNSLFLSIPLYSLILYTSLSLSLSSPSLSLYFSSWNRFKMTDNISVLTPPPPHNSICAHLVVLKGGPLLLLCTCTSTVRFSQIFTQFALPINQSCPCCPSGRQFHKVEFKVVALVTVTENVTVDVFVVVVVTTVIVVITVVVVYCCCCLLLL